MNRYKLLLLLFLLGLGIFSASRLLLLILYYNKFEPYTLLQLIKVFIGGIRFDASILMTVISPIFLLLLLPIKSKLFSKILLWLLFIIYLAIALFLVSDVLYFGYVNRHVTNELTLMGNDMSFMVDFAKSYTLEIMISIIVILVAGYFFNKVTKVNITDIKKRWLAWVLIIPIIAVSYIVIRGNMAIKPITIVDAYAGNDSQLGALKLNGLFTASKYIGNSEKSFTNPKFFDNDTAMKIFSEYIEKPCSYPNEINNLDKPNIVLILVESMSSYFLNSFSDNNFNITPNLDSLTKESINFRNHYAINKRTITSLQSALTGIPPINGVPNLGFGLEAYMKSYIGNKFQSLGYNTIFLQTAKRRSFYIDSIAETLGFKDYYGMEDTEIILDYPDKKGSYFGWDYETLMLASDKIKESYKSTGKPFFVSILTGTMHTPYAKLPERFMKFPHNTDDVNGYMNTLYYTDWAIGEFITSLRGSDFFNNTIFIITADHVAGKFEDVDFPSDFKIPLIIYRGGSESKSDINNLTTHLDLYGALLDIIGYKGSRDVFERSSIFCKDNDSVALIFHGSTLTVVAEDGYINHTVEKTIDYALKDNSTARINNLTKFIKAYHQVMVDRLLSSK